MSDASYVVREILSGIYQLKMPLPFRLDHINLYLIEDDKGWLLVDTGLNTQITQDLWNEFLASDFFTKPIQKIILTHLHPDHIGMSAWLSEKLNVPVFISPGEWNMINFLWRNDQPEAAEVYRGYWSNFGIAGQMLDTLVEQRINYKNLIKALPRNIQFIAEGDGFFAMGRHWSFIAAPGHSPEHLCLWNPEQSVLISGDHVLPGITPNISYHPVGLVNPLESYISSLEKFLTLNAELYLPAHGHVSSNLHERIQAILRHHREKCRKLLDEIDQPTQVAQALPIIFPQELPVHQLVFAYAETAAHLIYLANRKLLLGRFDGAWVFQANPGTQKAIVETGELLMDN